MQNKIELLAPAGDYDSLRAAVENGADAVYLGGKLFNARQFAGNFGLQELKDALDYAHIRGVNIYLTMNTLISDSEMKEAVEFASGAYLAGIDGIIVQDVGFAGIINRILPDLALHASTQMTVHNPEGARLLEEAGFKRVVLARELTLDEIRDIAAGTSLEVEIFIHGALCICYSGQCLMSSMIGGRSGNRGKCAQPCRLPYSLVEDYSISTGKEAGPGRYLLSPRDLCTLPQLADIASSGVKSLKIEGRMKSPEYVATVVRIYRKYLDMGMGKIAPESKDLHQLAQIFNRGGFTGGYISGQSGKELMCFEKPKNWGTYLGEVTAYNRQDGIVQVRLNGSVAIGDGIEIWNDESEHPGNIVTLIRLKGKNVKEAFKPDIVEIGNIRGRISKGCKVYKTSDKGLLEAARESFEGRTGKRLELTGEAVLKAGMPLRVKVYDQEGNEADAEGSSLPEKAVNRPLTVDRLADQLKKTGATPFEFCRLSIHLEDGLSLPVSEINEVRRKALDLMEQKRKKKYERSIDIESLPGSILQLHGEMARKNCPYRPIPPRIALYFYEWFQDIDYASLNADRLYLPFRAILKPENLNRLAAAREKGTEVFIRVPAIIRGNYLKLIREKIKGPGLMLADGILTGSPSIVKLLYEKCETPGKQYAYSAGQAPELPELTKGIKLVGDHSFNVFNTYSAIEYKNMGFDGITLSSELNLGHISEITGIADVELESIVYGRLPLMTSEYCPVGSVKGGCSSGKQCSGCCSKGKYRLKDRMGIEFPVLCDSIDCRSVILNSNVLFVPDAIGKLASAGISTLRLNIWNESPDRIRKLVSLHRELAEGKDTGKHSELIGEIKSEGFTKGHFYKGV